jgi:hypothetical protein
MKLDYQVRPALSEQMAMEFLALRPRPSFFKRFLIPFLLAICFASLTVFCVPNLVQLRIMGQEARKDECILRFVIGAVIGFAVGRSVMLARREFIKIVCLQRIRTGAAAGFPERTFSWDETGVCIASPVWRYEWKWSAVDAIWEGAVGVHFIWKGELRFSIPKHALPADVKPENLRETLRRFSPPMLPNTLQPTPADAPVSNLQRNSGVAEQR